MRDRLRGRLAAVPLLRLMGFLVAGLLVATICGSSPAPVRAQVATPARVTISEIEVRGNRRIEAETIRLYAGINPGQTVTAEELNLAARKIFATGLFADVNVVPEGTRLVITVAENPTINRISFEGNDVLDDEALQSAIASRPRRAYTRGAAEQDAQLIIETYRRAGRYGAEVTPKIIEQPDNRVDLVFEIFEGEVTEVVAINFVGNTKISDRRLRRAIQTREANILSFLFTSDNYDPDRLELDKQLLRRYYLERGYADFVVTSATAELSVERDGFFVTFSVEEGEQYSYGPADVVSSAVGLDPEEFRPLIETEETEVYNVREVERTIDAMTFLAGQKGYAFIQVRPQVNKDDEARTISITYELVEGPKVYIERIDIRGNTSTLDRVIRRQFDVVEGDAFDARAIQRARSRIQELDFFAKSDVRVEQGTDEDRAVVVVEVEEKLTGSIAFGIGYSSADGPIGSFIIREENFLGRGQDVALEFTLAGERQAVDLNFFEPAFLDRDLGAGFHVYYRQTDRTDESSYDERNVGFEPRIVFPTSEEGELELRYRVSLDDIDPIARERASRFRTSRFIIEEAGERYTSLFGYTYTHDLRDDPVEPRSGYLLSFAQDFAGVGGDARYVRTVANAKAYASAFDGDVVFSAELEGGALYGLDYEPTVTERFFLGGETFRGFVFGGFGPKDTSIIPPGGTRRANDFLGGNYYMVGRFQASFPIGLPEEYRVYGGVFADVGTLWGLDRTSVTRGGNTFTVDDAANLRAAVGFSIFWDSTFGPLQFNIAYPVLREDTDEAEYFRFSAGTRF
ncbi:MAG TPA: outer membrane protein assembly factor BamA [Paracoccaceae bacterium]|nr:outer membrane protein assembly factor BamA [Paracoccaceae bacterium]